MLRCGVIGLDEQRGIFYNELSNAALMKLILLGFLRRSNGLSPGGERSKGSCSESLEHNSVQRVPCFPGQQDVEGSEWSREG